MRTSRLCAVCLFLAVVVVAPARAGEKDEGAVGDILKLLNERGIVDDGEYQRLAAKHATWEKEKEGWKPKIEWSGDFRFRHESFWFDEDATEFDNDNRFRLRYRFRLNGKTDINDWASVLFQVSSGEGKDPRSNNQTLGQGVDFDPDNLQIKLAYAQLRAPESWVPLPEGKATLEMGKVPNPYLWKIGRDSMLWDNDITLEGTTLRLSSQPAEALKLYANLGYYIDAENGTTKDPHFFGVQLGGDLEASEAVLLGARGTYYQFNSLDSPFVSRMALGPAGGALSTGGGNVSDGLTGNVAGENTLNVLELAAYLTWKAHETWPITVYGDWAQNLAADDSDLFAGVSEEDTAWGVGVEVGDRKKLVLVGVGWWHIEANAFPSQFIESDLFDGFTNREGFAIYGSREVLKNTEFTLTLFLSDEIESELPGFATSVRNADRARLQADMLFKF